ncbi:MAG: DUF4390 domain-containing protein [Casimicrobiaceae bacterium]|nr:DUF4390 domain-containing protein [Casimicrobiaceae bacterium]
MIGSPRAAGGRSAQRPSVPVRPLWAWMAIVFALLCTAAAVADTIRTKSAVVRVVEDTLVLDAEFEFSLTPPLEEALVRGTPLYFVLDVEIARYRAWWFDEPVRALPSVRRLSYSPLTNTYRVDAGATLGPLSSFATLEEALRQIRLVRGRPLSERGAIRAGERYEVALRLRLDSTRLPKPLQVNTLVSREWWLASDWYRVVVGP